MELASIFTDNAVFAANKPIAVFGKGNGEGCVELCGNKAEIENVGDGWLAELSPLDFGGPYDMTVTLNGEIKILHDIYIGKVYLLMGQSNAEFTLGESNAPKEQYVDDPLFRFFKVQRFWSGADHIIEEKDGWLKATAAGVGGWNAIAYLMGKNVRERDGVAVGVVACCQGASVIESWMPVGEYPYDIKIEDKHFDHVYEGFTEFNGDGMLYNGMFKKLIPFRFTKAVWYQGESDTTPAEGRVYEHIAAKMFKIFRRDLRDDKLGFVVVQIADFDPRNDEGWHCLQEAQLRIPQVLDGVEVVISKDVCQSDIIHPVNKSLLSDRISKLL